MAIVDEIFNKKNGGQFFFGKKTKPEGGLVKDHTFPAFFFCTLPLQQLRTDLYFGKCPKISTLIVAPPPHQNQPKMAQRTTI